MRTLDQITQENEIASKYGVPTLATCKLLDWKEETLFTYIKSQEYFEGVGIVLTSKIPAMPLDDELKAPQMHEIINLIPNYIRYGTEGVNVFAFGVAKNRIFYESISSEASAFLFSLPVTNNNYAEAYAKMYLLLKENGHLK